MHLSLGFRSDQKKKISIIVIFKVVWIYEHYYLININSKLCLILKYVYLLINIFMSGKKFAKFRCSSHNFLIETGRHLGIPREERYCQYCYTKY